MVLRADVPQWKYVICFVKQLSDCTAWHHEGRLGESSEWLDIAASVLVSVFIIELYRVV